MFLSSMLTNFISSAENEIYIAAYDFYFNDRGSNQQHVFISIG